MSSHGSSKGPSRTLTTFLLTIGKMMASLAGLAMAAALSRLLDKSDYGSFRQIIMIYFMGAAVFRNGVPLSVYYFMPRLKLSQQRFFVIQTMLLLMLQGAVVSLVLYFGANRIGQAFEGNKLPDLLRSFALYPIFMLPIMALDNVLMSFGRVKTLILFNIVSKCIAFFVVVVPIYIGYSMVISINCWVIFAGAQLVLATFLMLSPVESKKFEIYWEGLWSQCKYSLPFILAGFLMAAALYSDKIIVSFFGGSEQFACYANGVFEVPIVGVIGMSMTMALLPDMVRYVKDGQIAEFLQLWHRALTKAAAAIFPLMGWLMFFAPEAIVVLFGKQYTESAMLFQIYLCVLPVRIQAFQSVLVPLKLNWLYATSQFVDLAVRCVMCYLFYQWLGLPGVVIGAVLSTYASVLVLGYGMGRMMGFNLYEIWPFRQLLLTLVCGIGSAGAAYCFCFILDSDGTQIRNITRLVVGGCVSAGIYILLVYRFKIINLREFLVLFKKKPVSAD